MKKILCVILALSMCICTLCSCTKDTSDKNFAVACYSMPETFDPQIADSEIEKTIALNCFDTLLRPDENGVLQCLSAESYTVSSDGLVYTFKIRDGLKYFVPVKAKNFIKEKGGETPDAVTAYDFAFGITRAVLPETEAPDYMLLSHIKNAEAVHGGEADASSLGVKATDATTLVITLEKPDGDFLYALSQAVCAPCNEKFFNLTGGRYGLDRKYSIFNGAFYVSNTSSETSVSISKNENYKGIYAPVPNMISFYLNDSKQSVATKIKKGTYDCAFTDSASVSKLGSNDTKSEFKNTTYTVIFNFTEERFSSLNLRKGLIWAVDFSAVDNKADGLVAPDYLLDGKKITNSGVSSVKFNVDGARKCLKKALEELEKTTLDIEIICTSQTESVAKNIVVSWQKNIGVELNGKISVLENKDFDKAIAGKEFDLAIYPVTSASCDAKSVLEMFTSESENNVSGYSSEEYDRIFDNLKNKETGKNLAYVQSFLIENFVAVPVCFDSDYFVTAEDTSGIYFVNDKANIYFYKGRKK